MEGNICLSMELQHCCRTGQVGEWTKILRQLISIVLFLRHFVENLMKYRYLSIILSCFSNSIFHYNLNAAKKSHLCQNENLSHFYEEILKFYGQSVWCFEFPLSDIKFKTTCFSFSSHVTLPFHSSSSCRLWIIWPWQNNNDDRNCRVVPYFHSFLY